MQQTGFSNIGWYELAYSSASIFDSWYENSAGVVGFLEQEANITGPLAHANCFYYFPGSRYGSCSVTSTQCTVQGYGAVICRPPGNNDRRQ